MAVTSSVSSFDWHPSSTKRMLVISHSGQVSDVCLRERIAMVSDGHCSFQLLICWFCYYF